VFHRNDASNSPRYLMKHDVGKIVSQASKIQNRTVEPGRLTQADVEEE